MGDEARYEPAAYVPAIERDEKRAGRWLPLAKRLLRAHLESYGNHHDLPPHSCEWSNQTDDDLWLNERYHEERRIASGMAALVARESWFDPDMEWVPWSAAIESEGQG